MCGFPKSRGRSQRGGSGEQQNQIDIGFDKEEDHVVNIDAEVHHMMPKDNTRDRREGVISHEDQRTVTYLVQGCVRKM